MTKRTATYYPRNISTYVPRMEFAADVVNETTVAELGAPKALDADGIWDGVAAEATAQEYDSGDYKAGTFDGSATALTTTPGMIDAKYGRCLSVVASSGADHVVTVYGRDYLGQPMREAFTLDGTTALQGKKAFKYVDRATIGAGQAGDTVDIGWTDVLGVPYRALKLISSFENNNPLDDEGQNVELTVTGVDTAGTGAATFTAPISGYIIGWDGVHTTAMTTNPSVMDLIVAGAGQSAGDGVAPIAVAGLVFGKRIAKASWIPVTKGDTITLTSDGAGTAGVSDFTMIFSRGVSSFTKAVDTDPQTATTGDPRGTYAPSAACDGSIVHTLHLVVDIDNLHGVAHYNA